MQNEGKFLWDGKVMPRWGFLVLVGVMLLPSGCAVTPPPGNDARPLIAGDSCVSGRKPPPVDYSAAATDANLSPGGYSGCGECQLAQEGDRDSCFTLRPGRSIPCTKTVKLKNGKKKTVRTTRTSRCQPQSLVYARCRSGIDNCRLGDTSPVQWFACAKKQGVTSPEPKPGAVIILDADRRRNMPTGHPAYVEEVCPNSDGTWTLRLSHTNYDRRCNLDSDAKVVFCQKTMKARFVTGPWSMWASDLKVLGFIVR